MQMGGLLGTVTFENSAKHLSNAKDAKFDVLPGEGLAPFWPYIWLGQWTHAGKNTSMGLGKYEIVEPA